MADILAHVHASGRRSQMLEAVYTGLLVVAFLLIAWFAGYVVWKLYQGQR